jgi:hypothetical protein
MLLSEQQGTTANGTRWGGRVLHNDAGGAIRVHAHHAGSPAGLIQREQPLRVPFHGQVFGPQVIGGHGTPALTQCLVQPAHTACHVKNVTLGHAAHNQVCKKVKAAFVSHGPEHNNATLSAPMVGQRGRVPTGGCSALAELEPGAGARLTVLLAFNCAGVTGEEPGLFKGPRSSGTATARGARQTMPHGTSLTSHTTTADGDLHAPLAARFGDVNGCSSIIRRLSRGKKCSSVRPLTETVPSPGMIQTRAVASLRRPVA